LRLWLHRGCPSERRPNYFDERLQSVLRIPGWVKRKAQSIEHEASPAARARETSERLKATRIDLLELGLEPLAPEELVQKARHRRFVRRVTGNANQGLREIDDLVGDQRGEDAVFRGLGHRGGGRP
jgi:hypothetical protein